MPYFVRDERGKWWEFSRDASKKNGTRRRPASLYTCSHCGERFMRSRKDFNRSKGYCSPSCRPALPRTSRRIGRRSAVEHSLGRPLRNNERVLHIDGDQTNVAVENLQVVPLGYPIGSVRTRPSGYAQIKTECGWVLQHRHVMEEAIGRPLAETETVHHINGDRTDNRLVNLQIRRSHHGPGQAHQCLDCGSHNVTAIAIADIPGQGLLV